MKKQIIIAGLLVGLMSAGAQASIAITEWMYQGVDGEFVEFTNTGAAPIDMTGWSYSDSARVPGSVDLSAFGVVQPGQSVVLTEAAVAAFEAAWSLAGVAIIGENTTQNLGRNDEINLYDSAALLVDRLTFGDQTFLGSIRTQTRSGNPLTAGALGANDPYQWELATAGDVHGSYFSTGLDQANPGSFIIPEPGTLALLLTGGLALIRRRR